MKDKTVAGLLALFLGWAGIHRFYLQQPKRGLLYIFLTFAFGISFILGFIDAIVLLTMDKDLFDLRYNRKYIDLKYRNDNRYPHRQRRHEERQERRVRREEAREKTRTRQKPIVRQKSNPYKASGIKKFKEYDYDGAIEDFKKALEIDENDIASNFNIACAYSLNEDAEKAFYHLDKAVTLGFNDFDRIATNDSLAFLRIQPEFDAFKENGYQLTRRKTLPRQKDNLLEREPDLLDQLKKLAELRQKGIITEKEFTEEKRILLEQKTKR